MKIKILFFLLLVSSASYWLAPKTPSNAKMELKYIVTETQGPDSFDPVNADRTQNLSAMRMLYATPLEVDGNNSLTSKILKSFEYKRDSNKVIFEVRDDQKYSDGTILTANDVAMAIARMAYYHPQFPVIKNILGIKAWIESKQGLINFPQGIEVSGQKVIVTLTSKSANPLFRFCLELFSVIPSKCINLETTKITCDVPPSSGYFTLKSRAPEELIFEKRPDQNSVDPIAFKTVRFIFRKMSEACKVDLASNEVISGVELDFIATDCLKGLAPEQVHWMPSARFGILRFNPNVAPFNTKEGRQLFAETVREILHKNSEKLLVERGLFSRLIPGYIANEKLAVIFDNNVKDSFKNVRITLPQMQYSGLKIIFDAVITAARDLNMDVQLIEQTTNDELQTAFLEGKIPVVAGASGFWAQDPIGDVSMWFTPNLHRNMRFVWSDKEIYKQIAALETEIDPFQIQRKMEYFNQYISDQSVLAPVVHFRRLFISSRHITKLNLPQAVTSPAPWQLVPVE